MSICRITHQEDNFLIMVIKPSTVHQEIVGNIRVYEGAKQNYETTVSISFLYYQYEMVRKKFR